MDKANKTEFERWINSIPVGDYQMIRTRIMEKTGVSRATFSAWKNGRANPDFFRKIDITVIANEYDGSCPFDGFSVGSIDKSAVWVKTQ